MGKRLVALATTLACALALAACGSNDSGSTSSSAGSATTSKASGEPIKLMTMGPTNAPGFSLPSIPVGAQVAIDEINAAGGLNGHPLKLITCNDENNPNTATQCARTAIKEKVAALVGGLSVFDLKAIPALQRAGIPWIGLTTPDATTQSNLFLLGGEGPPGFAAIGMALAQTGCKKVAVLVSAQAAPDNARQIQSGVKAGGATVVKTLTAPKNSADFAPVVAGARAAGAQCIGAGTGPGETGPLIKAINAGKKLPLALASGGLPDVVLTQLGKAADGVLAVAGYLPFGSQEGMVQQLEDKIHAKYPKVPLDQFAQSGYASVKVVQEAAKGLKDVTPQTLTQALPKVTNFDTGLGPVANFSKPLPVPGFERVFNPKVFVYKATNGNYELAQPDPIDTTPALKILSGQ